MDVPIMETITSRQQIPKRNLYFTLVLGKQLRGGFIQLCLVRLKCRRVCPSMDKIARVVLEAVAGCHIRVGKLHGAETYQRSVRFADSKV